MHDLLSGVNYPTLRPMLRTRRGLARSVFVSPYFWVSVALELLLVILTAAELPVLPLALLGAGLIIGGFVYASARDARRHADPSEPSAVSPVPAENRELTRLYRVVGEALAAVAGQPEGNRKETVTHKLVALGVQFRALASGDGTRGRAESWYVAHDAVLGIPDLKEYRAVVRVQTAECVRNAALQESLRAIFAAVHRGVFVERLLVLPESLWPVGQLLPANLILPWIEEQHNNGGRVILLRERDLAAESAPVIDTCVFDDWAVGTRNLDDYLQTICVTLDFTPTHVRATLDRLDRLSYVGIPFGELLDRAATNG